MKLQEDAGESLSAPRKCPRANANYPSAFRPSASCARRAATTSIRPLTSSGCSTRVRTTSCRGHGALARACSWIRARNCSRVTSRCLRGWPSTTAGIGRCAIRYCGSASVAAISRSPATWRRTSWRNWTLSNAGPVWSRTTPPDQSDSLACWRLCTATLGSRWPC